MLETYAVFLCSLSMAKLWRKKRVAREPGDPESPPAVTSLSETLFMNS